MFSKILVCLDGSSIAEQILPYAVEEALHFKAKIYLLQVITMPSTITGPEEPAPIGVLLEQVKHEETLAHSYLERIAGPIRQKGIETECVTLQGTPGETIMNFVTQNKVNLVAIATHGRSGLKRLVFGSVADFLLRESGLPMLVIRPREPGK